MFDSISRGVKINSCDVEFILTCLVAFKCRWFNLRKWFCLNLGSIVFDSRMIYTLKIIFQLTFTWKYSNINHFTYNLILAKINFTYVCFHVKDHMRGLTIITCVGNLNICVNNHWLFNNIISKWHFDTYLLFCIIM